MSTNSVNLLKSRVREAQDKLAAAQAALEAAEKLEAFKAKTHAEQAQILAQAKAKTGEYTA